MIGEMPSPGAPVAGARNFIHHSTNIMQYIVVTYDTLLTVGSGGPVLRVNPFLLPPTIPRTSALRCARHESPRLRAALHRRGSPCEFTRSLRRHAASHPMRESPHSERQQFGRWGGMW